MSIPGNYISRRQTRIYLPYYKWLKSVEHLNNLELAEAIMRVLKAND